MRNKITIAFLGFILLLLMSSLVFAEGGSHVVSGKILPQWTDHRPASFEMWAQHDVSKSTSGNCAYSGISGYTNYSSNLQNWWSTWLNGQIVVVKIDKSNPAESGAGYYGNTSLTLDDSQMTQYFPDINWNPLTPIPQPTATVNYVNGDVDLTWSAATGTHILGYNIYRSTDEANFSQINVSLATGTSFTDNAANSNPDPVRGQQYYYAIKIVYGVSGQTKESKYRSLKSDQVTYPLEPVTVTVGSPNGNEIWAGDSVHDVTWSKTGGAVDHYHIYYTTNSASPTWTELTGSPKADSPLSWTVPLDNSSTCKIKVVAHNSSHTELASDTSNNDFTIDSTAPGTPTPLSPLTGSITNDATPTFSWSAPIDNLTGIASYEIKIDTTLITRDATTNYTPTSDLSNGSHTWQVKAKDGAGNWGSYSTTQTFTVDATAPTTATVTTPSNGSYYNATSMPTLFQGNAKDNTGGSGLNADSTKFYIRKVVGGTSYYWNGSDWNSTTVQWLAATHSATTGDTQITWLDNVSLPTWADGTYYVKAKATDKAGNNFEGSEITFYYDTAAPQVSSTNPANNDTNVSKTLTQITVTFNDDMDVASVTNEANYTITGGKTISSVIYASQVATLNISGTFNYSEVITCEVLTGVKDKAGNALASKYSWKFTIAANPAPFVTSITWEPGGDSGYVYGAININGTNFGATQGSSTVELKFQGGSYVTVPQANIYTWEATKIQVGIPKNIGATFAVAGTTYAKVTTTNGSSEETFALKPRVYGRDPASGPVGSTVKIVGTAFHSIAANNTVSFNGTTTNGATVQQGTDVDTIEVTVPSGATSGAIAVTVNGQTSNNDVPFTVTVPTITNVYRENTTEVWAYVWNNLDIWGSSFGSDDGSGNKDSTTFHVSLEAAPDVWRTIPDEPEGQPGDRMWWWEDGKIQIGLPASIEGTYLVAGDRKVQVTAYGQNSNIKTIEIRPNIYPLSPSSGPVGTLVTISGYAFGTETSNITVNFTGAAGVNPNSANNTSLTVAVPADAADGPVTVTVNGKTSDSQAFDVTHAPSGPTNLKQYKSDGSTEISAGGWTNQSTVVFKFTVSDVDGGNVIPEVRYKEVGGSFGSWQAGTAVPSGSTGTVTISNFENGKEYEWQARANDGTLTSAALNYNGAGFADFKVDTQAPIVTSFTINAGSAYTTTIEVTLQNDVSGATEMRFQNAGGGWSEWENYAATKNWTLTAVDGLKTINAEYRDAAGNTSSTSDTITLDTQTPTITSFSINAGNPAYATTTEVALQNNVSGAAEMRFRNSGGSWSSWENYAATKNWTLTSSDGLKTVEAEYRDAAGNTSNTSDDITLDTQAPVITSFSINAGNPAYTTTTEVTLQNDVSGAAEMRSQNAGGAWSSWENYAATKNWTLTAVDGSKTVNAEYRDAAGNAVSTSDTITLDSTVPTVSQTVPASDATNVSKTLTQITVTFDDDMDTASVQDVNNYTITGGKTISSVNYASKVATLNINGTFEYAEVVTCEVKTGVKDKAGNALTSTYSWKFTIVANPAPFITSIAWEPGADSGYVYGTININGTNFGDTQGSSTVELKFQDGSYVTVPGSKIYSWANDRIQVGIPKNIGATYAVAGTTSAKVTTTNGSSEETFTLKPRVYGVSPSSGPAGSKVKLVGTAFHPTAGSNTVNFNGGATANGETIQQGTDVDTVEVTVPSGAATGAVSITANGQTSNNDLTFTVTVPTINNIYKKDTIQTWAYVWEDLDILGSSFGLDTNYPDGSGNKDIATDHVSIEVAPDVWRTIPDKINGSPGEDRMWYWEDGKIQIGLPASIEGTYLVAGDRKVQVTAYGQNSNIKTIEIRPNIYPLSPSSGPVGTLVTISGYAFGIETSNITVNFTGAAGVNPLTANNTSLTVAVPADAADGAVTVTVNGKTSDSQTFNVTQATVISNVSITREGDTVGSGVKVTWQTTPSGAGVDIYTKTGPFSATAAEWTKSAENVTIGLYSDGNQVGNGSVKYYKIVPAGQALANSDLTSEVVGKFDWHVNAGGFSLVSLPFIPSSSSPADVIGNQMTAGWDPTTSGAIYGDNNGSWNVAWKDQSSGNWLDTSWQPTTLTLEADKAYWIFDTVNRDITIVGKISAAARTVQIKAGWNFIGSAYPMSTAIASSGLGACTGGWDPSTSGAIYGDNSGSWNIAWKDQASGNWLDISWQPSTFKLEPGKGYWFYEPSTPFTWNYPKPY